MGSTGASVAARLLCIAQAADRKATERDNDGSGTDHKFDVNPSTVQRIKHPFVVAA